MRSYVWKYFKVINAVLSAFCATKPLSTVVGQRSTVVGLPTCNTACRVAPTTGCSVQAHCGPICRQESILRLHTVELLATKITCMITHSIVQAFAIFSP